MLGNVFQVFRRHLEVGGNQPEGRQPVGQDRNGDGGNDNALLLPGDPETPDEDGVEDRQRGGAIEIVGGYGGREQGGQGYRPGPAFLERQPGEGQSDGDERQRAHVRAFAILDEHAQPLRLMHPGVFPEARQEQEYGRHQRRRHRAQPGEWARFGPHAHQQVDSGDAQGIKERHVKVVGLDRPEAGELGDCGRAVAHGGRVDVVETRACVPQGLPLRMRPVLAQKARIGDERALDGGPLIRVPGFEVRADEHGGVDKHEEEIEQDFLPPGEFPRKFHVSRPDP